MGSFIFISHCQEDLRFAITLYDFFKTKNFTPWLDKVNLLPGQNWDFEINKALKKADFIVLILSKIAVKKRGYIQKEFKQALDYCKEKLDDDIFIIPIKIDDCEIPDSLAQFQWIEYHEKDSFEQIAFAIQSQYIKQSANLPTDTKNEPLTNSDNYDIDNNINFSQPLQYSNKGNLFKKFLFIGVTVIAFIFMYLIYMENVKLGSSLHKPLMKDIEIGEISDSAKVATESAKAQWSTDTL